VDSQDARVLLLGTGGGITPKRGRQSTAAALRCAGNTYIVDCGNGVGPQLIRAGVALGTVRAIFITHHHLDHVADFGTLLAQCWSQVDAPIALIGPPPLRRMFELYRELYAIDLAGRVADEGRRPLEDLVKVSEILGAGVCFEDDNVRVAADPVVHPPLRHAFAYRFDARHRSVVFSGDTTPVPSLAYFASGAHTLVHEATLPEALATAFPGTRGARLIERLRAAHTPVREAARIASLAGVSQLVLSPLVPADGVDDRQWIAAAREQFSGHIVVGRDLLEVVA
jgi:ribonuclease BN (tRNA processing enzyme)